MIERRRYCRSCGQRHELPRYQAVQEPEPESLRGFAFALFAGVVMFAAVFIGLAVASV